LAVLSAVVPPACARHLPRAPSGLPAPIIATTACARFTISTDGRVSAAPLPPLSTRRPPTRRFDIARPGPRATAFALRAQLYLARLGEAPRVVGRGVPLGWTRRGTLVALRFRGARTDLDVRDAQGRRLRVLAHAVRSYALDRSGTLFYVDRLGTLVRSNGRTRATLGRVRPRGAWVQPLAGGWIALTNERRLEVVRRDGSFVGMADFGHGRSLSAPTGGRGGVAYAVTRGYRGYRTRGIEDVYLLRADGTVARLLRRRLRFALCARGADLAWRGRWLLYHATEGATVAIDTATGRTVDLSRFVARLPGYVVADGGHANVRVAWAGPVRPPEV
jgi:hypothetical protein